MDDDSFNPIFIDENRGDLTSTLIDARRRCERENARMFSKRNLQICFAIHLSRNGVSTDLMKREDGSESEARDRSAGGSVKSKDCKV